VPTLLSPGGQVGITHLRWPESLETAMLLAAIVGMKAHQAYSDDTDDAPGFSSAHARASAKRAGRTEALVPDVLALPSGEDLTRAISAAIVRLYAEVYGHNRTTASTYINDNVVVCILEDILTSSEQELVDAGNESEVIEGRIAFQADREDEFSAAIERLTQRRVVAFMSANQTSPGVACELFFLTPINAVP
jgi:uncharacterized protein YbcI